MASFAYHARIFDMDVDLSFYGTDLTVWLMQYGSFALFILLGMGIFGLPVPEETLMVLAGILMTVGDLAIVPAILAAYSGTAFGITMSYLLGRTAGRSIINKYGKWLHITSKSFHQTSGWFTKVSKWILLIGYLIPGLRHFTGLFAGSAAMSFKEFALFAYTGAIFWVMLYLSIGYFWGPYWLSHYVLLFQNFELFMDLFTVGLVLACAIYFTYRIKFNK